MKKFSVENAWSQMRYGKFRRDNRRNESLLRSACGGSAAVRKPQLFIRGSNFVVLLGRSVGEGIVGIGSTVPSALRAFDQQYLKTLRPPALAPEVTP